MQHFAGFLEISHTSRFRRWTFALFTLFLSLTLSLSVSRSLCPCLPFLCLLFFLFPSCDNSPRLFHYLTKKTFELASLMPISLYRKAIRFQFTLSTNFSPTMPGMQQSVYFLCLLLLVLAVIVQSQEGSGEGSGEMEQVISVITCKLAPSLSAKTYFLAEGSGEAPGEGSGDLFF